MYYVKLFDSLNCEYQELRTEYKTLKAAQLHAQLMSKRKGISFTYVETEDFDRYGWFEKGRMISL